jgi:hypothetical protein
MAVETRNLSGLLIEAFAIYGNKMPQFLRDSSCKNLTEGNYCVRVTLNREGTARVTLEPGSSRQVQNVKWFVLPPAEEWYYRSRKAG